MSIPLSGMNIYLDNIKERNSNSGLDKTQEFKDISRLENIGFKAGDSILFTSGQFFYGILKLYNIQSTTENPLVISSIDTTKNEYAHINGIGEEAGIRLVNCSGV